MSPTIGLVAVLAGAALLTAWGAPRAAEAAVIYDIDITRLVSDEFSPEEEQRTFSGGGTIEIEGEPGGPFAISALSLGIETLGELSRPVPGTFTD